MGLGAAWEGRALEGKRLVVMLLMELGLMETESGSRSEAVTEGGLATMRTEEARRTAPRMRDQLDFVGGVLMAD